MDEITMVRQLTADPAPPDPATVARMQRLLEERIGGRGVQLARRTRARQIVAAAGTLTVAAGAVAAVAALRPASQPASPATKVSLAAWSVAELGHGDIRVTIRDRRDPAGLQARLRADGVPANVGVTSFPPASCQPASVMPADVRRVYTFVEHAPRPMAWTPQPTEFVIHRSALPSGVGVGIFVYEPRSRL